MVAIAAELGAPPGQVALAWTLARGAFAVIGPRNAEQLPDYLAAAELVLGPAQIARLDEVSQIPRGYPHELLARYAARPRPRP